MLTIVIVWYKMFINKSSFFMEHYYSQEEKYYSQEIANSPSNKNFFAMIEEILKEYQAEGLTRQEAIKKFAKEQKEAKKRERQKNNVQTRNY